MQCSCLSVHHLDRAAIGQKTGPVDDHPLAVRQPLADLDEAAVALPALHEALLDRVIGQHVNDVADRAALGRPPSGGTSPIDPGSSE